MLVGAIVLAAIVALAVAFGFGAVAGGLLRIIFFIFVIVCLVTLIATFV